MRFQKTALAVTVVASLLCVSALAELTPQQVVGTWYMQSRGGQNLAVQGIQIVLELNRDKSVTLTIDGTPLSDSWSWDLGSDNQLHLYDQSKYPSYGNYELMEDGSLQSSHYLKVNGEIWDDTKLVRELIVPEALPGTMLAVNEEAFYGDYAIGKVFEKGYMMGDASSLEEGMEDLCITIEYAQVIFRMGEEKQYYLTDFVDGKLLMYDGDAVVEIGLVGDGSVIFTDGNIALQLFPVGATAGMDALEANE